MTNDDGNVLLVSPAELAALKKSFTPTELPAEFSTQTQGAGPTITIEQTPFDVRWRRNWNSNLTDAQRKAKRLEKKAERNRKRDQRRKNRR